MQTVLFIHGTGTREPAYTTSFKAVQEALTSRLGASHVRIEPCCWGETCGSRLFRGGISIPDFDTTKAVEAEAVAEEEYELALWAVLYKNPGAELQLLALRPSIEIPPGQEPAGEELEQRLRKLDDEFAELPSEQGNELRSLLATEGLLPYFKASRDAILARSSFRDAMQSVVEPITDYRLAIARALLACAYQIRCDDQQVADGDMFLDGTARDKAVELLIAALGGREASPADWVRAEAGRLVSGIGSHWFGRRRGRLSDQFAPFGADVIAYQARPAAIRGFIRDVVNKASTASVARGENGKVVLLAHSLGGIAAVEMLVEGPPMDAVEVIITVGSQVPLLYELDALGSLPLPRDKRGQVTDAPAAFPDHFPRRWLNIYDRRDFLSYRGEGLFPGRIRDVEVNNRQPFPQAHSAYWSNTEVWDATLTFLGGAS